MMALICGDECAKGNLASVGQHIGIQRSQSPSVRFLGPVIILFCGLMWW